MDGPGADSSRQTDRRDRRERQCCQFAKRAKENRPAVTSNTTKLSIGLQLSMVKLELAVQADQSLSSTGVPGYLDEEQNSLSAIECIHRTMTKVIFMTKLVFNTMVYNDWSYKRRPLSDVITMPTTVTVLTLSIITIESAQRPRESTVPINVGYVIQFRLRP